MLEIEMKFPVALFEGIRSRLSSWGAATQEPLAEVDHYFNAPDRDFARTDEALRLRRIGEDNRVTYKGPKRPGPGKIRTEIEVPLAGGQQAADDFTRLLQNLGFRSVAVVRKERTIHRLQRQGFSLEICLDDVIGLGKFIELEILAPEDALDAARDVLQILARELELTHSERRSYLEMLLEKSVVGSP